MTERLSDITTESSVFIDGPIDKVWAALTTPELIKQWFFGVETESDWTSGSPIVSRSEWQGESRVDKGVILTIEPPHLLVHHSLERSFGTSRPSGELPGGHLAPRGARRVDHADGVGAEPPLRGGQGDLRPRVGGGAHRAEVASGGGMSRAIEE